MQEKEIECETNTEIAGMSERDINRKRKEIEDELYAKFVNDPNYRKHIIGLTINKLNKEAKKKKEIQKRRNKKKLAKKNNRR